MKDDQGWLGRTLRYLEAFAGAVDGTEPGYVEKRVIRLEEEVADLRRLVNDLGDRV